MPEQQEERRFAYSRIKTPHGTVVLLVTNDEKSVALIAKYEEDGSLEKTTPTGRTSVVRGEKWGYRILGSTEIEVERDDDGLIRGVGALADGVTLTSKWENVDGPYETMREALDTAARFKLRTF